MCEESRVALCPKSSSQVKPGCDAASAFCPNFLVSCVSFCAFFRPAQSARSHAHTALLCASCTSTVSQSKRKRRPFPAQMKDLIRDKKKITLIAASIESKSLPASSRCAVLPSSFLSEGERRTALSVSHDYRFISAHGMPSSIRGRRRGCGRARDLLQDRLTLGRKQDL